MPKRVLKDKMSKLNSPYNFGNQFECYQGVYLLVVSIDVITSSKSLWKLSDKIYFFYSNIILVSMYFWIYKNVMWW